MGMWEKILEMVAYEPDLQWLMIDSTFCKCHQHASGAVGGNEAIGLTKWGEQQGTFGRGCAWYGLVRAIVTNSTVAYCSKAIELISDFPAKHLLADEGYDRDSIIEKTKNQEAIAVIPPRSNRKTQRYKK